jgi:hypothetical protein
MMADTTRLLTTMHERRLIRRAWTGITSDGRETVCLLAALAPVCGIRRSAAACPADVMPRWMAHLTVWIDDGVSAAMWEPIVWRYAALAQRWDVIDAVTWGRLDFSVRRIALETVLPLACSAESAVESTLALHRRAEAGDWPSEAEWVTAREAAWNAAQSVGLGAASLTRRPYAIAKASETAAMTAWVSVSVDRPATAAMSSVRAAVEAVEIASMTYSAAPADQIATAILDAIDAELPEAA